MKMTCISRTFPFLTIPSDDLWNYLGKKATFAIALVMSSWTEEGTFVS